MAPFSEWWRRLSVDIWRVLRCYSDAEILASSPCLIPSPLPSRHISSVRKNFVCKSLHQQGWNGGHVNDMLTESPSKMFILFQQMILQTDWCHAWRTACKSILPLHWSWLYRTYRISFMNNLWVPSAEAVWNAEQFSRRREHRREQNWWLYRMEAKKTGYSSMRAYLQLKQWWTITMHVIIYSFRTIVYPIMQSNPPPPPPPIIWLVTGLNFYWNVPFSEARNPNRTVQVLCVGSVPCTRYACIVGWVKSDDILFDEKKAQRSLFKNMHKLQNIMIKLHAPPTHSPELKVPLMLLCRVIRHCIMVGHKSGRGPDLYCTRGRSLCRRHRR